MPKKPTGNEASEATAGESRRPLDLGCRRRGTWHDVTGTYSIEAVFLRSHGGKVTLKRSDGKEITLPLDKLSEEDRAYVAKQVKPVNPFE